MKVALDIGHCSTGDQGAVSRDGLAEHPFWAQYTPAITKELQRWGTRCASSGARITAAASRMNA